ncbi:MAG: NADPH:quinone reductase [Peltula sp. TS41687]|nr:MAG: NADPH:quinone reductase [Peltula sp. TS41687]
MPPIPPTGPKTMRGIQISTTGPPSVLQHQASLPIPHPGPNEVLIQNTYIGVNFIDTSFRTGQYPCTLPAILGCEAGGTIARVGGGGDTYGLQPGDRVVYMAPANGAYAEYTAAPAKYVVKIPEGMPASTSTSTSTSGSGSGSASASADASAVAVAVAGFVQGLTALTLIREAHAVQRDDWVLVHAAAGGCGLWLCGLLRAVGARTIGTASSGEKLELARRAGAAFTVDYTVEDVVGRVKEITGGQGVVAVFDGVGKDTFDADLEMLGRKGTLVSFGNSSGDVEPLHLRRLAAKNLKLVRPRLYGYLETREEVEKYTGELFEFMMKEKMDVHIHEIYKLEDVKRAHEDLESRKTTGKLLLKA